MDAAVACGEVLAVLLGIVAIIMVVPYLAYRVWRMDSVRFRRSLRRMKWALFPVRLDSARILHGKEPRYLRSPQEKNARNIQKWIRHSRREQSVWSWW
jgi:hypothetical protein